MPAEITIKFPRRDVDAINAAMKRSAAELGISMGGAMRMAGYHLSRTLGTSTKVADKKRPYKVIQERKAKQGRPKQILIEVTREWSSPGAKNPYRVLIDGGRREANKSPQVRIGMSGLAKSSWKWASRKAKTSSAIGWGSGKKGVARSAKSWGQQYSGGASRFRGDDVFYRVENRLPYIEDAMIPGRVDTALQRAAGAMEHHIDEKLKGMGAK